MNKDAKCWNSNVLFVDDDDNILKAMQRNFRKSFSIQTAANGDEALEVLKSKGPFAVIVSDMRMPGMNGAKLLTKVRELYPETIRILLTGYADIDSAIAAINDGQIFRFLTKPSRSEQMHQTLEAAFDQYALVIAEKQLLAQTLQGSIKMMMEMLSLTNPIIFARSVEIREYITQLIRNLQLPKGWMFELSAMLSQIGLVSVPHEIVEKLYEGKTLNKKETVLYNSHPEAGYKMLEGIPRLGSVAEIIRFQRRPCNDRPVTKNADDRKLIHLGNDILHAVIDYDQRRSGGENNEQILEDMLEQPERYNCTVVRALKKLKRKAVSSPETYVDAHSLHQGMVLADNIITEDGVLVVPKGQPVTVIIAKRLQNYHDHGKIPAKVKVSFA